MCSSERAHSLGPHQRRHQRMVPVVLKGNPWLIWANAKNIMRMNCEVLNTCILGGHIGVYIVYKAFVPYSAEQLYIGFL